MKLHITQAQLEYHMCVCANGPENTDIDMEQDQQKSANIFNVLKAPTPEDTCRKRKVATVPPRASKLKLSRSNPSPGLVTPLQPVKEFPNEELKVSTGKIFCTACSEVLSTKKSTIENHISSAKHSADKERLARKDKRETDVAKVFR